MHWAAQGHPGSGAVPFPRPPLRPRRPPWPRRGAATASSDTATGTSSPEKASSLATAGSSPVCCAFAAGTEEGAPARRARSSCASVGRPVAGRAAARTRTVVVHNARLGAAAVVAAPAAAPPGLGRLPQAQAAQMRWPVAAGTSNSHALWRWQSAHATPASDGTSASSQSRLREHAPVSPRTPMGAHGIFRFASNLKDYARSNDVDANVKLSMKSSMT